MMTLDDRAALQQAVHAVAELLGGVLDVEAGAQGDQQVVSGKRRRRELSRHQPFLQPVVDTDLVERSDWRTSAGDAAGQWRQTQATMTSSAVGSVSEVFLYAMIVRDAMEKRFDIAEVGPAAPPSLSPEKIQAAKLIQAHLLSTTFHPLVDDGLLGILNARMKKLAWPVHFDRIDLRHVFAAV